MDTSPVAECPDDAARDYLGPAFGALARFAELLEAEGELRGLIGPRESSRLWSRHIVNSAAVWRYLPVSGVVADVGTGAGFPGVVVAAGLPDVEVHLIEPMERRVAWLAEVVSELGLDNVVLHRARGEELHGQLNVSAVTSRAVASMAKLTRWCAPLLVNGGSMVALKGERATTEIDDAQHVLRRYKLSSVEVREELVPMSDIPTRVVVARKHA